MYRASPSGGGVLVDAVRAAGSLHAIAGAKEPSTSAVREDAIAVPTTDALALRDAHARFGTPTVDAFSSPTRRLEAAAVRALPYLPDETRGAVEGLLTPTNVQLLTAGGLLWAASHTVGVGEIADAAAVIVGAVGLGSAAAGAARDIGSYATGALSAHDERDLDAAGRHLARAIGALGIDGVSALLLHRAAGGAGPRLDAAGEAAVRTGPALAPETSTGVRIAVPSRPEMPTVLEARRAPSSFAPRRSLGSDEAAGGHTIRLHVGQSVGKLRDRLRDEPDLTVASSFYRASDADRAIGTLKGNPRVRLQIDEWLRSGTTGQLAVSADLGKNVGRVLTRDIAKPEDTSFVKAFLVRDGSENGYHVRTAFPTVRLKR